MGSVTCVRKSMGSVACVRKSMVRVRGLLERLLDASEALCELGLERCDGSAHRARYLLQPSAQL